MAGCRHALADSSASGLGCTATSCVRTGPAHDATHRFSPSSPCRKIAAVMPRVTDVEPLEDHRLRISFGDGAVCDVDFSGMLHGELGEPLRDPAYFRRVRVDEEAGTIVWPNGLDPDPLVLHGDFEPEVPGSVLVKRLTPPLPDAG